MATQGVTTLPALVSPSSLIVRPVGDKCEEGDLMRVICRCIHSHDLSLMTGVGCNELNIQQMHGGRQSFQCDKTVFTFQCAAFQ